MKSRIAGFLNNWESGLSLKQKKVYTLFLCMAMATMSGYWLYEGLFLEPEKNEMFLQQHISRPQDISLPDSLNIQYLQQRKRQQRMLKAIPDSSNK